MDQCFFSDNYLVENDAFIDNFLRYAKILFFSEGDFIYKDGCEIEGIYLVMKGTVEYCYTQQDKNRSLAISTQGSMLGLTCLVSGTKHSTVCCRTACTIAFVDRSTILSLNSEMQLYIMQMQSRKMRLMINQLSRLSTDSIETRLLRFLYEYALDSRPLIQEGIPICARFSKQQIADLINSSREYVSVILKSLQNKCRLKVAGSKIIYYPEDIKGLLDVCKVN